MAAALEHGLRLRDGVLMRSTLIRALAPWLGRGSSTLDRVTTMTGISAAQWRQLQELFPELPHNPGPGAARARARLRRLAGRALGTGRWTVRIEGDVPAPDPAIYLTAHLGALQAMRYVLRARGIPVATAIGSHNLDRTAAEALDEQFDRRHPIDFPHALPSARVHQLRSGLRRGSLILAGDLPEGPSFGAPLLGGHVRLDPRPQRLARAAGVPCRPIFLTLPGRRWVLTVGAPLPSDEHAACEAFARILREVAAEAPLDLDGVVYWNLSHGGR